MLGSFCTTLLDFDHRAPAGEKAKACGIDHAGIWDTSALQIRTFIESQYSRKCPIPKDLRLPHVLSNSLSSTGNSPSSPAWALHTLLTLLILSSSTIYSPFTHPRSVKLFVTLLGEAQQNGQRDVRKGGECAWRVLIWALERLYGGNGVEADMDVEERVFKVVKQELRGGNGELLVATLVNASSNSSRSDDAQSGSAGSAIKCGVRALASGSGSVDVVISERRGCIARALVVIGDMTRSGRKSTVKVAVEILTRLVSGIGSSTATTITSPSSHLQSWIPNHRILPHALFDGISLTEGLSTALGRCESVFKVEDVRQLAEEEVTRCWEALVELWEMCVEIYFGDGGMSEEERMEMGVSFLFSSF